MNKISISFHNRITFIGISMGVIFPILSFYLDFLTRSLNVSFSSFEIVLKTNPIQWIILSAPIILGSTFYFLGKIIHSRESRIVEISENETKRIKTIESYLHKLNSGEYDKNFEFTQNDSIYTIFENFRKNLSDSKTKESNHLWFSDGINQLNEIINQNLKSSTNEFCSNTLLKIAKYSKAQLASIYLLKTENEVEYLCQVAGYGIPEKNYLKQIFSGENLVGQVFTDESPTLLTNIPEEYTEISSGLGHCKISTLYILPLIFNSNVVGVIEFGFLKPINSFTIKYLNECSRLLAISIHNQEYLNKFESMENEFFAFREEHHKKIEEFNENIIILRNQNTEQSKIIKELKFNHQELLNQNKELIAENTRLKLKIHSINK